VRPSSFHSYTLVTTPTVRRQLAEQSPEAVAAAALEFLKGPLLHNPHRVGRRLSPPLDNRYSARRGTYRVIYRVDDGTRTVNIVLVTHRRDAYRSR
jgi:mRNA interferase RelE/StbE